MTELSDFQEVIGFALDIPDEQAALIQRSWPSSEKELLAVVKDWRSRSGSQATGLSLLVVCESVWKRFPGDLALSEGRTILYHPNSGLPIDEGSPMDGIQLETLAFLRWSIVKGLLKWTDEVAISREVKGADCVIADLPNDRFYGKNSLPLAQGGEIDWSNVGLSQAKHFVESGFLRAEEEGSIEPIYRSGDGDTLEEVLCSIISLKDAGTRDRLLKGLPPRAVGYISRSSAFGTDIYNIVEAVVGFGKLTSGQPAINALIDNAIGLVAGTSKVGKLISFKED